MIIPKIKDNGKMKYLITETQFNSLRRRLDHTESIITMINGVKKAMNAYDVCFFDDYEEYESKVLEKAANHFIFWSLDSKLPNRPQNDKNYNSVVLNMMDVIKSRLGSKIKEHWIFERRKCGG